MATSTHRVQLPSWVRTGEAVTVRDGNDRVIASAEKDSDGYGTFVGLTSNTSYTCRVFRPDGWNDFTITTGTSIEDSVAKTSEDNTLTGDNVLTGRLSVGEDASAANLGFYPSSHMARLTYVGSGASDNDHICHYMQTLIKGDWTNDNPASNPGILWGRSAFHATGNAAGDADGLNGIYGELIELDIRSPDATIGFAVGLAAEAAFANAAAGATLTSITSLKVNAPSRKDGATGGTAGAVRGIYLETVPTDALGATGQAYTLYAQGGLGYWAAGSFQAKTLVAADKAVSDTYALPGGRFVVQSNGAGNDVLTVQNYPGGGQTNNPIRLLAANGSTVLWSVNPSGGMTLSSTLAAKAGAQVGAGGSTYLDTTDGSGLRIDQPSAGLMGLRVKAAASPTADLTRWLSSADARLSRIDKDGRFITRVTSAPADGDLLSSEAALWFDATNGSPKLMVKAKQADGTVVTGSVTLT